jgi:uncharacterized membrane protein
METKYKDAMYTGLKCGVVIATINLIFGLIIIWLYSTSAMTSYMNTLTQPYKNLYNSSYNSTSYVFGQPPTVFYLVIVLALLMFLIIAIGVLATGLLAVRFGKQPVDTRNETFLTGALSGHAAFVPIFIVMLFISIMETETGSAANIVSSILPGISATIPFVIVGEYLCFCLPAGGFISGILSGLGALGYAYSTHRIKSEKDDALEASKPPTPWKG